MYSKWLERAADNIDRVSRRSRYCQGPFVDTVLSAIGNYDNDIMTDKIGITNECDLASKHNVLQNVRLLMEFGAKPNHTDLNRLNRIVDLLHTFVFS